MKKTSRGGFIMGIVFIVLVVAAVVCIWRHPHILKDVPPLS